MNIASTSPTSRRLSDYRSNANTGTEKYILGIINLRGTVLPIVDLQQKLFFVPMEFTEDTRVIVIDVANRHVGLIVDEVLEVKGIPASK
jgi:purine-binding chemotaxis protein CheW